MHQVILGLYSIINLWNFRKDEKEELYALIDILFAKVLITCVFELAALALSHSFSASKPRLPIQNITELGAYIQYIQMFSLMLIYVLYTNHYGNLLRCLTDSNVEETMGKSSYFSQFMLLRSTFDISNRFCFWFRITNVFSFVLQVIYRHVVNYLILRISSFNVLFLKSIHRSSKIFSNLWKFWNYFCPKNFSETFIRDLEQCCIFY